MKNNLKNKKVLVYGLGKSGISSYELLKSVKAKVYTFDDIKFPHKSLNCDLNKLDFVVLSPGVPENALLVKQLRNKGIKIISEIELAYQFLEGDIIAITGTNGKTTTVSLLGHIFKHQNSCFKKKKVFVAGNIGLPASQIALKTNKNSEIILELSSFQLENIVEFKPNISMILNLAPDHLDRYSSYQDYINAKFNIFKNQDENDFLILNYNINEREKISYSSQAKVRYFSINDESENISFKGTFFKEGKIYFKEDEVLFLMDTDKIKLIGNKNLENILASVLVAKLKGLNMEKVRKSINSFKPLSNRLEFITKRKNVTYINDSKATNIASAVADINAFSGKKVVIFGGSDKGEDFINLAKELGEDVITAFVYGETKQKIIKAFNEANFDRYKECEDFTDAVKSAINFAENLNEEVSVILSPACASFDEFENYIERGKRFKELVLLNKRAK